MKKIRAIGIMAIVLLVGFCQTVIAQSSGGGGSLQCYTYGIGNCPPPGPTVDCSINACRQIITYEGGSGGQPVLVITYICDANQEVTLKSGSWNTATPKQAGDYADGVYISPVGSPVYCAEVRSCSHGQACPPGNRFCTTISTGGYGTAHYAAQISGTCP